MTQVTTLPITLRTNCVNRTMLNLKSQCRLIQTTIVVDGAEWDNISPDHMRRLVFLKIVLHEDKKPSW